MSTNETNKDAARLTFYLVSIAFALYAKWWGLLVGALVLVVAQRIPKEKQLRRLLFKGAALTLVVSALSSLVSYQQEQRRNEEKQALEAKKAAEQEAKEKAAAEAKALKEQRTVFLQQNAAKHALKYTEQLKETQQLLAENKIDEAIKLLAPIAEEMTEYEEMNPIPSEIVQVMPFYQDTRERAKIRLATKRIEENLVKANKLTTGNKPGPEWSIAKDLFQESLDLISDLEKVEDKYQEMLPKGLSKTKRNIEKRLQRATKLVARYEKKKKEQEAYLALCGEKPVGCGGGWDGECVGTESAFQRVAHDPSDVDVERCSAPVLTKDDCWHSTCSVIARNGFGARIRQQYVFRFSALGVEVVGRASRY